MCCQETISSGLNTRHHVSVDDTTAFNLYITFNQCCKFLAYQHLVVLRSIHLTTGKCNGTGKVNGSVLHQSTNEDNLFGTQRPNHLALVDGRNMVNLNTNVTSRSRTIKHIHLTVLGTSKSCIALLSTHTQINLGQLTQSRNTCL